jgi:hypothetical protein
MCAAVPGAAVVNAQGGKAGETAPPPRRPSIQDSPGYIPLVDPESASVALGRRLSAPKVSLPFRGGTRSLDDLGRAVCRALQNRDLDSLQKLCIDQEEFRGILWREFPQSRPVTGLTWEDAWRVLDVRLVSGTRGAIADHGGRPYQFVRFERADTTALYKNFKLHNGLILIARNDLGELERWGWLRSVAERRGAFKIYSLRD